MVEEQYALDVFHFDENKVNFDILGHENDTKYWYATDLMRFLEYESYSTFKLVINKAISACASLNINISENFIQVRRDVEGMETDDFKLSRFACYLVSMNGDPKKKQVAKAQVYFVTLAETFRNYIEESQNIERISVRDDLSEREKSLSGVVRQHGVTEYALFQNAGYRGMYNMNLTRLKDYKGFALLNRSLLDFMGKEELAANLFRLTQTESKIKKDNVRGQGRLEDTAEIVGRQVRNAMMEISGTRPEDLSLTEDINKVKTQIRGTEKKFKKLDRKK